jgi:hypothetical protein
MVIYKYIFMYVLKLYVEYITRMINVFFWYVNYEYVCTIFRY